MGGLMIQYENSIVAIPEEKKLNKSKDLFMYFLLIYLRLKFVKTDDLNNMFGFTLYMRLLRLRKLF